MIRAFTPSLPAMAALALALALLLPAPLLALCGGEDLRPTLTGPERAELADALDGRRFPEGNHWRATRGESVIHLIGTMHIDDPRFEPVITRLSPLIRSAGTVLLEMTDVEEQRLQAMMARNPALLVLEDTSLPALLNEEEWRTLSATLASRGIPGFMAAKFRPWYISILLAMPSCMALDGGMPQGLDGQIEDIAREAGVPVAPLEAFDAAISVFAEIPLDRQLDILRSSLAPPEDQDDLFTTLAAAYFEERHAETWAVPDVLAGRFTALDAAQTEALFADFSDRLLVQRNRAWIDVILDAAGTGDAPLVVAFGAAHLSGADGVLALLEDQGFTMDRLPF
ncbi:TraB/GumN family protein [Cognatishimia sp. F0-27]|uniref:TraB/GumN family protein n=1 Tax=Cognatishimia sp. F0-27 TaxID=2816855 RepID=UPI001D0C537E|nr:TraB/GumN family protein [Cognatishimia sp. F0-27]MCC1493946.1 TraB/GumN family protein [Cognatishimia sp. F0-27]